MDSSPCLEGTRSQFPPEPTADQPRPRRCLTRSGRAGSWARKRLAASEERDGHGPSWLVLSFGMPCSVLERRAGRDRADFPRRRGNGRSRTASTPSATTFHQPRRTGYRLPNPRPWTAFSRAVSPRSIDNVRLPTSRKAGIVALLACDQTSRPVRSLVHTGRSPDAVPSDVSANPIADWPDTDATALVRSTQRVAEPRGPFAGMLKARGGRSTRPEGVSRSQCAAWQGVGSAAAD